MKIDGPETMQNSLREIDETSKGKYDAVLYVDQWWEIVRVAIYETRTY